MIKKISEKIGLTPAEIKVLLFLLGALLIGYGVKKLNFKGNSQHKKFDYSKDDSVFAEITGADKNLSGKNNKLNGKKVDYKQEVLDFNSSEFRNNVNKTVPAKAEININTAGIEELARLPGIGKKTAEKIIIFRKKKW